MSILQKELRLITTIRSWNAALAKDKCGLLNRQIPPHQRRVLDSIIRQAIAINEATKAETANG